MPDELQSLQTGLMYRVNGLSNPDTRASVQDVFNRTDPPEMYMSQCRLHSEVYAIEVKEVVSRTVRIGAPGSRYAAPVCEACVRGDARGPIVCRHVVWVMDQVAKQAQGLCNWNPGAILTMTSSGYAAEIEDPYRFMATYRLDLLAARLNCRVAPPAGESRARIDHVRIEKIKDMLFALTGSSLLGSLGESSLNFEGGIARTGDIVGTLFRMLYSDDTIYGYFCRQMDGLETASDRFHGLQRLADKVFAHRASVPPSPPESAVTVAWEAMQIDAIVREIGTIIQSSNHAGLGRHEHQAAAEALVHILGHVVARHSQTRGDSTTLYHALIGNSHDRDFIIGQLARLSPVSSMPLHELESLYRQCCELGAPDTYLARFDAVINRLRNICS